MLIRKNLKAALLTLAIFASPIMSHSQQVTAGINSPQGQNIIQTPGLYEQYSKTPVFQSVITGLQSRNSQAAQLYQDTARAFDSAFNDVQTYVSSKLMNPAIASITDSAKEVALKDYAANVQGYIELKRSAELKIALLEEFPKSLAGRIDVDAPGSGVNSVATITAGLDFSRPAAALKAKLADVENQLKGQEIAVRTKNKGTQIIKLLDMSLVKADFTSDDFRIWAKDIEDARRLKDADRKVLTVYSNKLIQQILVTLANYGKGERWRQNMHGGEYEARLQGVIAEIADAFWQRAYFRMRYGIDLGMIGIKYDTKVFGIDRFMTNLNKITFHPVQSDSSFFSARQKEVAELVKTSDSKGQSLSKIVKGEVGFIKSTNSVIAAVMGQDSTAKALVPIVGLILNDLYEENLALTGKRNELISRYKARYYSTAKPSYDGLNATEVETLKKLNPNGYSDREVTLMRELEIDFNDVKMQEYKSKGFIPTVVARTTNADTNSLFGNAQAALRVAKIKAPDYAKAESIQRTMDAYNASQAGLNGQSDVDSLLDLK